MRPYLYSNAYYLQIMWHSFLIVHLLKMCEQHSLQTYYRWNPVKCVVLDSQHQPIDYKLYKQALPHQSSFVCLEVSFKLGGFLDSEPLLDRDCTKALDTTSIIMSIRLWPIGFSKLLSSRFYTQIVCPQMEYGLAIGLLFHSQLKRL